MTQGEGDDIINSLPRNVVDRILELLPVHDAAKTSILSRKWRYIWASHPYLALNNFFCKKLTTKSESVFRETVDVILLQHIGDIVKFDLDVSGVDLSSFTHIDRWMLYVTRNGVKELTLNMSKNVSSTYKVPSYIFNCRTLTHLTLFNCIVKPPNSFFGFDNLITLHLERITFVPATEFCVINAPLLINLILRYCDGTQYLDIVVSTGLKYLSLRKNHGHLNLNCFMNCKRLSGLYLWVDSPIPADERSSYEKFIFSLSSLETITLDSFVLEVSATCDKDETVMKYLDKPGCLDRPLGKLEDVVMHHFRGSKSELFFIKLLFAYTPSLVTMNIKLRKGTKEERRVTKELMRFPRASPKAILFDGCRLKY